MNIKEATEELQTYKLNNSNYDEEVSQAIETVLAELEKKDNDIHRMQELLDISDANNFKKDKIISLMAENIYKNIDMLQMLDIAKETNYDLEKVFNGLEDEKVLSIIKQYFEKKIEEDK